MPTGRCISVIWRGSTSRPTSTRAICAAAGRDVLSICGSDEHGVAITIKARKEGVSPKEIIDRYHNLIKRSFERLGMSFDIYSRTSSPVHAQTASDFFRKLYAEGKFVEKTSEQYYDEEAQQFLADPLHRGHPVPTARTKRPTATSARSAGRRFRPTN